MAMSTDSAIELVPIQEDGKELRTILEEESIDPEGRTVFVDGKCVEDLRSLVPADSRIVVLNPVSGG